MVRLRKKFNPKKIFAADINLEIKKMYKKLMGSR